MGTHDCKDDSGVLSVDEALELYLIGNKSGTVVALWIGKRKNLKAKK